MIFKVTAYGMTSVGKVRDHNEDAFHLGADERLYVVADGMGGHAAGEVASRVAIESVAHFYQTMDDEGTWPFEVNPQLSHHANKLIQAIRLSNRSVLEEVKANEKFRGMGTTIVTLIVRPNVNDGGDSVYLGHVGDSRIYRVRNEAIELMTSDHSWINSQVQSGLLTPEAARNHPLRNVITRALGSDGDVEVDVQDAEPQAGDIFIMCTDGLNTMVEDQEILQDVLRADGDVEKACDILIEHANRNGGEDNVTVIVLRLDPDK